jgi:hypothetical protein
MQLTLRVMGGRVSASRFHRAMSWCLIVGLCFQLIALTQHHHEITAHPDNCLACYLMALSSGGGTPPAYPVVMAPPFFQAFWIALQRNYVILSSFRNFIRPLFRAPPVV